MNRVLALKIIDCLRVAGRAEADFTGLQTWPRNRWAATLPWLHTSGLALHFLRALQARGQQHLLPRDVLARLERNLADNNCRVAAMAEEFAALNRCFENAGLAYAALKGFAMIPDYSPDASLRTQADFDFLIAPESQSKAERGLRAAGYVRQNQEESGPFVFFHSARPLRLPASGGDLYSAALPRRLELHTRLWNAGPEAIHSKSLETALERTRLHCREEIRFPVLADEDALSFQILHLLRHIFDFWCRLSLLLEVAYFLQRRAHDDAFWRRFAARVESDTGLPAATGVVFTLAIRLFGGNIPAALADWIRDSTPRAMALWIERYGRDCALENFMGDKFSLLLRREFTSDVAGWHKLSRHRLLPFHRPNRASEAAGAQMSSRLAAGLRQASHVLRRCKFHFVAGLRYAWELPRWRRLLRETSPTESRHTAEAAMPISAAVAVPRSER